MARDDTYGLNEFKGFVAEGDHGRACTWLDLWIEQFPKLLQGVAGNSDVDLLEITVLQRAQSLLRDGSVPDALQLVHFFFEALANFCETTPSLRQRINRRAKG
jgi:hypothetical protein